MSEVTWELIEVTPTSRDLPPPLTWLYGEVQYLNLEALRPESHGLRTEGPALTLPHSWEGKRQQTRARGIMRKFEESRLLPCEWHSPQFVSPHPELSSVLGRKGSLGPRAGCRQ